LFAVFGLNFIFIFLHEAIFRIILFLVKNKKQNSYKSCKQLRERKKEREREKERKKNQILDLDGWSWWSHKTREKLISFHCTDSINDLKAQRLDCFYEIGLFNGKIDPDFEKPTSKLCFLEFFKYSISSITLLLLLPKQLSVNWDFLRGHWKCFVKVFIANR
jgi:hypothetical protein